MRCVGPTGLYLSQRGAPRAPAHILLYSEAPTHLRVGAKETRHDPMWAVAAVLVIAWVFRFTVLHVSSALIHLLLVVAVIAVIARLFTRRSV